MKSKNHRRQIRRAGALLLTTFLVPLGLCGQAAQVLTPKGDRGEALKLSAPQLQRLRTALEPYHRKYDEKEKMLREPFRSPGYHTTLSGGYVHPTRSSLHYAVALLDTGEEQFLKRAEDILRRVISLQDQNPESRTYGIWSWFLEEPLEKMSPPDWNWADFCGTALLQVALDHRRRLSPDLAVAVDAAIQHAARSIKKRNVGPGYTNIAIMGTYVTLVAGELYDWPEMRDYALARWRRFQEHTRSHGAFNEYNSPTYTIVALSELGRMRAHVRNPEARRTTEAMYRLAWEEMARHFHPPTRQWAGPHSRCYGTLLGSSALALVQRGTAGRVDFGADQPAIDETRLPLPCPSDLEPFFVKLKEPREVRQQFIAGEPPVIGTTWLTPVFTLGSVNRGDLWNQRRSLVAYWGDEKQPAYLHLRFLHDDYDFAAAQFFSVQRQGRVLAAINFAVDGGDRHVSLDRIKNGTISARDLRLRLEFGGAAGHVKPVLPTELSAPGHLPFGAVNLVVASPFAAFDGQPVHWENGQAGGKSWLDLVLFSSGTARPVNLAELKQAVIGLALEMNGGRQNEPAVQGRVAEGNLTMEWGGLKLQVPVKPAAARALQTSWQNGRN